MRRLFLYGAQSGRNQIQDLDLEYKIWHEALRRKRRKCGFIRQKELGGHLKRKVSPSSKGKREDVEEEVVEVTGPLERKSDKGSKAV